MAGITIPDPIITAIHDALEQKVKELREQTIREAVARFESQLRCAVSDVAISLSEYFTIDRIGTDIRISCVIKKQ